MAIYKYEFETVSLFHGNVGLDVGIPEDLLIGYFADVDHPNIYI